MTLNVYTSRISSKDPDRFDVTRKSGGPAGEVFAPSWSILRPALAARKEAKSMLDAGDQFEAFKVEEDAWADYVPAFLDEMRASYKLNRSAWDALVSRSRVVLVCYCVIPERCHRTLLARNVLSKLGATYRGEL